MAHGLGLTLDRQAFERIEATGQDEDRYAKSLRLQGLGFRALSVIKGLGVAEKKPLLINGTQRGKILISAPLPIDSDERTLFGLVFNVSTSHTSVTGPNGYRKSVTFPRWTPYIGKIGVRFTATDIASSEQTFTYACLDVSNDRSYSNMPEIPKASGIQSEAQSDPISTLAVIEAVVARGEVHIDHTADELLSLADIIDVLRGPEPTL